MNIGYITAIDEWLDGEVDYDYKHQPLAQDAVRVGKIVEEAGEAFAEFILMTGQNPRKGKHPERQEDLVKELADVVWTGIAAIQHFTKNVAQTECILENRGRTLYNRVPERYK